ncbi:hypothetical protein EON78_06295, partial [bacterium]
MINNSVNRYSADNSLDRKPPSNEELKRQGITSDTQITEALNNWSFNQSSSASATNTITSDKLTVTKNANSSNFPSVSVDLSSKSSNPDIAIKSRPPSNEELRRQGYVTENQMTEALNNWSAESSKPQVQINNQPTAIPIQQTVNQPVKINKNLAAQNMSDIDRALLDHPSLKSLGKALKVSDYNDPTVQRNVSDLAIIPEHVLKRLADSRIDRIQFGTGGVPDFEGNENYRNVHPRHESGGRTFDIVAGIYDPNNRRVTIGSLSHGSISLTLHEVSHAIGSRFKLDNTRQMRNIHENLFSGQPQDGLLNRNFLSPYLKGPKSGSEAGMQETFAEALATHLQLGEKVAVERYGTELI